MKKFHIILFLFMFFSVLSANTDINGGNVSGTWLLRNSPFIIHNDITIASNDTLYIDEGVVIKFDGFYHLEIHGGLRAIGTPSNHILFTVSDSTGYNDLSVNSGAWMGIVVNSAQHDVEFYYTDFKYTKDLGTNGRTSTLLGRGGAVCVYNSQATFEHCTFYKNYALDNGGALAFVDCLNYNDVKFCNFSDNISDFNGGALSAENTHLRLYTSIFHDNNANYYQGGAVFFNQSTVDVQSNLFYANSANAGGAVYTTDSQLKFLNNTIAYNSADEGAGFMENNYAEKQFYNNIVFFNTPDQIYLANPIANTFHYSDIQDLSYTEPWIGQSCISDDPLFMNAGNGNFRLYDLSPCIETGYQNSTSLGLFNKDLDNYDRISNSFIDMGAYEYNGGGTVFNFTADFRADQTSGFEPLGVQFYDECTQADTLFWEFGDGTSSTEKNPFHTYSSAGIYTVSLHASGRGGSDFIIKSDYITVYQATHIEDTYVSGHWAVENSPYIITRDIIVEQGDELLIDPGVQVLFQGNYTFTVYGTLLAQGTSSDSIYFSVTDTTGYHSNSHTGWGGIRFIDQMNTSPNTSHLSYCVIKYGKPNDMGGGLYFDRTADYIQIDHTAIRHCRAENGGAIALDNNSYPTFEFMKIKNNTAEVRGGAIYANHDSNFILSKSKISRNSAVTGSAIYATGNSQFSLSNTLISKNRAQDGNTITLYSVDNINFRNLTIVDNLSSGSGSSIFTYNTNLTVKNSIIWNPLLEQELDENTGSNIVVNYTNVRSGWTHGNHVYNLPPNFKNNISYKLTLLDSDQTSRNPFIDAGDPNDDFSAEPMPNGRRINLGTYGGTAEATYSCIVESSNIYEDADWENTEMHVVTNDITVQQDVVLNIEPGTIIQTQGNHMLHILGTIHPTTTRGDTIIFTNNYNNSGDNTPWKGILFESETPLQCNVANILVQNALNGITILNKNVSLSNAKIEFTLTDTVQAGITVLGASPFNLSNCEIEGYPTGISLSNNTRDISTPTLTNTRIRNSSSSSRTNTVGINITGNTAATIDSCTIEDYTTGISQSGTANQTASPTITNTRIRNSTSSSRTLQTAILLEDISSPQIGDNEIEDYDTAIKIITQRRDTSTPFISNTRLRNSPSSSRTNTSTGIYLEGNVIANISDNIIEDFDNAIKYIGTGEATRTTPTLSNNRIRNSTSSSRDSLVATGIDLTDIINITVENDSIMDYPIGIDIKNNSTRSVSTPTLINTRIRNSTSSSRDISYAIKINGSVAALIDSVYIDNYDYGVFYLGNGTATRTTHTLTNSRIRNSASSSRTSGNVGIYYKDVINSYIDNCEISEYPVAVKMLNNTRTTASPTLQNTRIRVSPSSSREIVSGIILNGDFSGEISFNEIVNQDSAIVILGTNANPRIRQNTIYFDSMESDDQGAIAIYSANSTNLEIENNTIYQYDYAFISDNATAILKNIIAWDESPTDEPITIAPEVDVSYSDISTQSGSVYSGTGNINQNPQFYLPKQGDFRLQTGSPCIDSGDPSITDPDGSVSDMGRYFAPDLIDFDSQSMFGSLPNHNVQFTQKSVGFNTNNTTWEWDVNNDGVYDISGINPTYNFTSAGIYTVKLRVTKYSTVDSLTKEKFIVIQSQQLPAPDNVQISVSNSDITLSWDPISWPNGSRGRYYIIYKSDNPNNDFEYLAYTNDTPSYTDTNAASDVRAFYKIIAYSGNMRGLNFFIQKHRFLNKTSIQKER